MKVSSPYSQFHGTGGILGQPGDRTSLRANQEDESARRTVQQVAYVVDEFVTQRAGTERQLLQLIHFLDRTRYRPTVALLRDSEYARTNVFPCDIEVLGISRLAGFHAIVTMLRFGVALRRRGCRLVHCVLNDSSMIAPPLLRLLGIRVLVSRRDMGFWYTPRKLWILRLVAPFVARYVANSDAVARVVRQRERVAPRRITVIRNGYVADERRSDRSDAAGMPALPPDARIVGLVANVTPIKRIDTLISAFALLACRDLRLVIVGDHGTPANARTRVALEALARELRVGDRLLFTGAVDDPTPYIERFSVAVLCSESEGFSNALIEYMKSGRPIVCTDTGGNPELIEDGRNGFLVPVGDAHALAARISAILDDDVLARRLGAAARRSVVAEYSAERMAREHMACYDAVLLGR